ncbi:RNA polymerase sigma-I factor [Sediminibacillus halophilus]|uniref:RNA polymerase sigma factor SigI n=1 Tax=Sediminibacillus halophilus TaxID=482461 RepID=A0A1G9R5Q0_9BACI|nr:RNA polymerase sigma-I factor [Sediminibacillus halophilus]SDM18543.1 RNA polymerase sigma factor [Sediminibacillus halophilus]
MGNLQLKEILLEIKNGNELERERLIRHYEPYILNAVSHVCKKYVTWSSDETSIGLIAFNRAIDTFEFDKGRAFLNYVYLLIQRDIIDYFRKEKRHLHPASDNYQLEHDNAELKASLESYQQSTNTSALVEEILELDQKLSKFNISFEQLESHSPKQRKTRIKVMGMAAEFMQHVDLVDELVNKRVFPVTSFTKRTGFRSKSIERHRKYLITIIMIQLHPEWRRLSTFVQVGPGSVKK